MGSNIDDINLEDIIFFTLEMKDPNTKFLGQTTNRCFENECVLPSFKVLGKPGTHILDINISNFGKYSKFKNNTYHLEINIKECNEPGYINSYKESKYIYTCYKPICEPPCNNFGKCVNNNVCDCKGTGFIGKFCNERVKLKRIKAYDIFIMIISGMLIGLSLYTGASVLLYKNDIIIKFGGGKNFLMLIVIGTIINCLYVIFRTMKRNHIRCLILDISKQMGFTLVFGTITIKSLRIYYAVCNRISRRTITTGSMYILLFIIAFIHIFLIMIYEISNEYNTVLYLTSDQKEYEICKKSNLKIISKIFNIIIITCGWIFAFSMRDLKKEYREDTTFSIYVYIVIELLLYTVDRQQISLIIDDIFNTIGPIIYSIAPLYDIFYTKYDVINERHKNELKIIERKNYNVQRYFDDYMC